MQREVGSSALLRESVGYSPPWLTTALTVLNFDFHTGKNQKGTQTQTEEQKTRYVQELQKHQVSSHGAGSKVAISNRLLMPLASRAPGNERNTLRLIPVLPNCGIDHTLKELLWVRGAGVSLQTFHQPTSASCYQETMFSMSALQLVWVDRQRKLRGREAGAGHEEAAGHGVPAGPVRLQPMLSAVS